MTGSTTRPGPRVSTGGTTGNLRAFIRLWDDIYTGDPDAVRPFPKEVAHSLDDTDPYLRHGHREIFVVTGPGGRPLARAVGWYDPVSAACFGQPTGLFSHFECVHSEPVARLLLAALRDWAERYGARQLVGPFSPKISDIWGVLVDGPGRPIWGMAHNPPYYPDLLTAAGLAPVQDLLQLSVTVQDGYPRLRRLAELAHRRFPTLVVRGLRLAEFDEEMRRLVALHNRTYDRNWGFIPVQPDEFLAVAREFRRIIRPEYGLVAELDGELIGMIITIPDINQVLHPMRGRLWPTGWWHLLTGPRRIHQFRAVLFSLEPRYRLAGIEAALLSELIHGTAPRYGITHIHAAAILDSNVWVHRHVEHAAGPGNVTRKRYRVYRGDIGSD